MSLLQFQPRAELAATLTDDDTGITGTEWKWYQGNSLIARATDNDTPTTTTYTVQEDDEGHRLKVIATYTDRRGSQTATFTFPNPVQESRDDNADPVFPSATANRSVPENTKKDMDIGARVRATDNDNDTLTYSVPDTSVFSIHSGTGQLMTKDALNHEAADATDVVVTATDSSGAFDTIEVTVNVTDVDEAPGFTSPPVTEVIQGAVRREVAENTASLGGDVANNTYTATDPEAGMVTLSLSGDDMSMFELGGADDNVLAFKMGMEPDFEMPSDKNKDNIYEVTVVATAGGKTAERDVTVKVTNAEEAGKVTLSGDGAQPRVGSEIKATLADSDGGVENVTWMWERGTVSGTTFQPDTGADEQDGIEDEKTDTYMVMSADLNKRLRATATYLDKTYAPATDPLQDDANATSSMFSNTATSMASAMVGANPTNKPPKFAEGAMTSRYVMENVDADTAIGAAVLAMDTHTDAAQIVYSLGGADKDSFTIEAVDADFNGGDAEVGGQIRTKAMLNYEMKSAYTVTVTATDSSGLANDNATITVTIHVSNVDERPVITEGVLTLTGPRGSREHPENGTEAVGTYMMDGSEAIGATMELMGDDAGDFRLEGSGMSRMLKFRSTPNYEMPMDMNEDNEYMVTVMARKGDFMDKADVTVMVTDVEELGMLTADMDSPISYMERGTMTVATYMADGPMANNAIWTLEGADADDFTIRGGMLEFKSVPDYESPMGGADDDSNTYMVTVKASAGGEMEMMDVTIMVTNMEEDGTVTLMPTRPSVGTAITASVTDLDNVMEDTVMWQWASAEAMDETFTDIDGATMYTYTPVEGDVDMYLRATATYKDGYGNDEAMKVTDSAVSQLAVNGMAEVELTENVTNVGTYTASGASGSIAWSLTGDDEGAFSISGGALAFSPAPNFEMPTDTGMDNVYMVTVMATADGNMASQDVTVTVTDMDEDGSVTVMPTSAMVGDVLTAMLEDEDSSVTNTTWQWASADAMDGTFNNIDGADSATYTVADSDAGMSLMATATYDDVHGIGKMVSSEAVMVAADTVGSYDTNDDGEIDIGELFVAIDAYFDEKISITELFVVIDAYFAS